MRKTWWMRQEWSRRALRATASPGEGGRADHQQAQCSCGLSTLLLGVTGNGPGLPEQPGP
jgi:hypothetical protein